MTKKKSRFTRLGPEKKHICVTGHNESEPSEGSKQRGLYIVTKMEQQMAAKKILAHHVARQYVQDFDSVLLDAGSTAELIAQELFIQRKYLSVMTINMGAYAAYTRAIAPKTIERTSKHIQNIADTGTPGVGLFNENELLLPGGRYVPTYEALFGDRALEAIGKFTPNVTIIGVSGLRFDDGVFCHGSEEVQVKRLLWQIQTDTRLIAADWTKIGRRDAHPFGLKVKELCVGATTAVVVTSRPPKNANEEHRREFDKQVKLMKDVGIIVDITPLKETY